MSPLPHQYAAQQVCACRNTNTRPRALAGSAQRNIYVRLYTAFDWLPLICQTRERKEEVKFKVRHCCWTMLFPPPSGAMAAHSAFHTILQSDSSLAALSGPSKVCYRDYLWRTKRAALLAWISNTEHEGELSRSSVVNR